MSDTAVMNRAEELRQSALALVRAGALEEALGVYDAAMGETSDEELRELITINKADAGWVPPAIASAWRRRRPHSV